MIFEIDEIKEDNEDIYKSYVGLGKIITRTLGLVNLIHEEDVDSIAYLGIWSAIKKYDPTKGVSFRTFVGRRIKFELLDNIYFKRGITRGVARSLSEEMKGLNFFGFDPDLTLKLIQNEECEIKTIEERNELIHFLSKLKEKEMFIISKRIQGFTLEEIAIELKCTRFCVAATIGRIYKKHIG